MLAQGLDFLHNAGVLHLDIKPDNIYIDGDLRLRIGDFGVAVLRNEWVRLGPSSQQLAASRQPGSYLPHWELLAAACSSNVCIVICSC